MAHFSAIEHLGYGPSMDWVQVGYVSVTAWVRAGQGGIGYSSGMALGRVRYGCGTASFRLCCGLVPVANVSERGRPMKGVEVSGGQWKKTQCRVIGRDKKRKCLACSLTPGAVCQIKGLLRHSLKLVPDGVSQRSVRMDESYCIALQLMVS